MKTFKEFISECELVEGYEPLPSGNTYTGMLGAISRKSRQAKLYAHKRRVTGDESRFGPLLKKTASQIKKLKFVLRNHDPLVGRFKELENQVKGRTKRFSNDEDKDIPDEKIRIPVRRRKLKGQKESYEYHIDEGKVEWDNPKRPLQSGLTPREKNRAKRISIGMEEPHKNSFGMGRFDLTDKDYERYGKLKLAHEAEKDKKVPRGKRHKFGLFKVGSLTSTAPRGVIRRQNKDYRNIPRRIDSKLYKNDERQKIYHTNDLKEPK